MQIAEDAGKMQVLSAPRNVCMNGVGYKQRQRKQLAAGAAFDKATPGRLMDLVAKGVIFLHQTTHSVFNRTDQMLDNGLQGDTPAIFGQVRPDR